MIRINSDPERAHIRTTFEPRPHSNQETTCTSGMERRETRGSGVMAVEEAGQLDTVTPWVHMTRVVLKMILMV